MACTVCVEGFNKTNRKRVICPYCPAEICVGCHKRYLMGTVEPAHCMSCNTAWSSEVCFSLLPKSFQHDYSVRRAELCVAQEKNLLPETMIQLQRERLHLTLCNHTRIIEQAGNSLDYRVRELNPVPNTSGQLTFDQLDLIEKNIAAYRESKREYDRLCCPGFVDHIGKAGVEAPVEENTPQVYLPCPYDNCKGFTTRGGTCGLCEKKVCLSCRMPKDADHVCAPEDVASVELLKKDCRPCPKCRAMIHRYDGCPQMFCTVCHAKFDWNTGELLKKIHNPHLTEWLLTHGGREQSEAVCGIMITYSAFPSDAERIVAEYYNHALHVQRYVIPDLRRVIEPVHASLRRKYLQSKLDEKAWVNELRLYNRKVERTQEIIQVLEMFHDVTLRGLASVQNRTATWEDVKVLLRDVTDSMNTKLDAIGKQYNIVVYKHKWVPRRTRHDDFFEFA